MNMYVEAKTYTSAEEMREAANIIRKRLMKPSVTPEKFQQLSKQTTALRADNTRLKAENETLRVRIEQYEFVLSEDHPRMVASKDADKIAQRFLEKHYPLLTLKDIKGVREPKRLGKARAMTWAAVHRERPDISMSMLGKLFNRDRTTVLTALRRCGAIT